MENSTGKTAQKDKTKTFLIGKELKTKDLRHTAAELASGPGNKTRIKKPDSLRRGAGQGAVRLLRCATALRVTPLPANDPQKRDRLMKGLDVFLERDRDRELFDLPNKALTG